MLKNFKSVLLVAMLSSMATFAYAEETVPVYDVDSYPPQFDGQADAGLEQPSYNSPQPLSMEKRISRAEQQIVNLQRVDLTAKLDGLQSDLQSLRGEVEQITRQLQDLQKGRPLTSASATPSSSTDADVQSLHSQVEELTHKLQQIQSQLEKASGKPVVAIKPSGSSEESKKSDQKIKEMVVDMKTKTPSQPRNTDPDDVDVAVVKSEAPAKATAPQPNVAEEQQIYQTAYDLIKAKKYNEAIAALQKMLRKYPSGQFAANAHYWLGELYGLLGKNDQSASEFSSVVRNYPDSPKVSDAQLKLGIIYSAQFKWSDAKSAFKKVINRYPGTASARLAAEQLKQIKAAGH